MSEQIPTPNQPEVNQFARRAFFQYISLKETGSLVEEFRHLLFSEGIEKARRAFPRVGLEVIVLLSDGYSSLPYIWASLRESSPGPLEAKTIWTALHDHLAQDPVAAASVGSLPRTLSRDQHQAIEAMLRSFESGLAAALDSGISELDVYATWIEKDQEHAILGMGGYLGEELSPFLLTLRSKDNPLPWWEVPSGEGTFLIGVLPRTLSRPMNSWLSVRRAIFSREFTTVRAVAMPPEEHEEIHTILALMLQHEMNPGFMESKTMLGGAAEYVTHALLSMREPDEYF